MRPRLTARSSEVPVVEANYIASVAKLGIWTPLLGQGGESQPRAAAGWFERAAQPKPVARVGRALRRAVPPRAQERPPHPGPFPTETQQAQGVALISPGRPH